MYAVIKQQLKYSKFKNIYPLLKELTHISKNLYNQALYIIRQEFFKTNQYKNYYDVEKELKETENYSLLAAICSQQTLQIVDQNFKSFFALCKKQIHTNIPHYKDKAGYFKICDPKPNVNRIQLINNDSYWIIPLSYKLLKKYRLFQSIKVNILKFNIYMKKLYSIVKRSLI